MRVQLSTDGGASWPTNLYVQVGTSTGSATVEGAFSLRTVDLAPYVNQSVRFRFLYDFTGGSAFPQIDTNPPMGWFVDNIQVADQYQKTQYSIGNPSAHAQQYLEYINRARANASVEATRLANETDPQIQQAYASASITPQQIINSFTASINSA